LSDLEEFGVIEAALVSFESSSDSFYLSPNIDESFRLSGSRDTEIFKISQHEIEFRAHEEIRTFLETPRISPPMHLSQGISFSYCLNFCFREIEDAPQFFFKEKDQMVFFGPSIHMFEQTPFYLQEFFKVKGPSFPLERFSKLDQGIFEVFPQPLHDVEVIVLERSFGPNFTDDFWEGGQEVEDNAVGFNTPVIELSEELFSDPTAVEPGNKFNIENSDLDNISGNLFVSPSSSGHIFINREGSRESELS